MTDWIAAYRSGWWKAVGPKPSGEIKWFSAGKKLLRGEILLTAPDGWLLVVKSDVSLEWVWIRAELVAW